MNPADHEAGFLRIGAEAAHAAIGRKTHALEDRMAYRWTIDVSRRLALVTLSGSVTGSEVVEAIRAVYGDP